MTLKGMNKHEWLVAKNKNIFQSKGYLSILQRISHYHMGWIYQAVMSIKL